MKDKNTEQLLNKLADVATEQASAGLADKIKQRIPHQLTRHKSRIDTVNIIIDLRVNKLAAAAVIIVSLILLANIFGDRDPGSAGLLQEGKLLIKYFLGKPDSHITQDKDLFYESLVRQGKEVVYYGDSIDTSDVNSVLMHWKLEDGSYKVVFVDLSTRVVNADELVKLQAQMLQNRAK